MRWRRRIAVASSGFIRSSFVDLVLAADNANGNTVRYAKVWIAVADWRTMTQRKFGTCIRGVMG
jgi:hypothetical protein